ncbi:MAG: ArnT family glycosyltransferase [Novosphingobium sp.]
MQLVIRRISGSGWFSFAVLLVSALILRAATLGDPIVHLDENFYLMVGAAMHHGAVPYIDIWDRKPLGIFLIYWAIAAISTNPWFYQLVALGFAVATAWVLARIARLWTGGAAALMAGISYIAMLNVFDGMGGQSPVFYNFLIALAAWLVLANWARSEPQRFRRAHLAAMALCGVALTIKQTTLFEGVLFGLAGLVWLWRRGQSAGAISRHAAVAIFLAVLPTALIALWYAGHGWWADWYHAMVTSNMKREGIGGDALQHNLIALTRLMGVFAGIGLFGLVAQWRSGAFAPYRALMLLWLAVAILSLVAVPNFFSHYALPVLVPLTPLAALGFNRQLLGPVFFVMNLLVAVILGMAFDFKTHQASRQAYEEMAATITRYRGARPMLVLYGPPLLYTDTGSTPMSPLVFPEHLVNQLETDVSPIRTKPEIERMIAERPSVLVVPKAYVLRPTNGRIEVIDGYLAGDCRVVWQGSYYEPRAVPRDEVIYACR